MLNLVYVLFSKSEIPQFWLTINKATFSWETLQATRKEYTSRQTSYKRSAPSSERGEGGGQMTFRLDGPVSAPSSDHKASLWERQNSNSNV